MVTGVTKTQIKQGWQSGRDSLPAVTIVTLVTTVTSATL
jgi:hypothetical protein